MGWSYVIFASLLAVSALARPNGDSKASDDSEDVLKEQMGAAVEELALAERLEAMGNSTRESRGLLKKVAFLAGMRVGGMVQSSGTLAASNSLRIFGKVVNSALSVSYGTLDELNPIPVVGGQDIIPGPVVEEPIKAKGRPTDDVTVLKNASSQPASLPTHGVETDEQKHRRIKSNFLSKHNDLVDRANSNNKYLRLSREKHFDEGDNPSP